MTRIAERLLLATAATSALAAAPAEAQETAPERAGVEEIIVTAQRRGENLQKVPVAVTAFSAESLETRGISDPQSLEGAVPSLTMSRSATTNQPYLRGVGSNGGAGVDEQSVATYIDGFYIASSLSNQYNFNNLARLEVLKGPQGTLFGRNATGGVIQLITKEPSQELNADLSLGYGNFKTFDGDGYVSGGLAPGLAADLAVQYHDQADGFGRNRTTGSELYKQRNYSIRSKWVYTGDTTKVTLVGSFDKLRSNGLVTQFAPETRAFYGYPDTGRFDVATGLDPFQRAKKWYAGLRIEQELGFAKFVSSSFYAKYDQRYSAQYTVPTTFGGFDALDDAKQYSQEFQLQGTGTSRLQWQLGVYLFKYVADVRLTTFGPAFGGVANVFDKATTSSVAFYGQATYEIATDLKLTGGLRYTFEKYKTENAHVEIPAANLDIPFPDRRKQTEKPTWRLALDYQMTPDVLGYVSYNRGIKSGGFSAYDASTAAYNPEQLDAYEVGLKTQLFDRTVRFNVAAFYYDYKDLQVNVIDPCGCKSAILNAATARVYGLDADFEVVPFENFSLSGGFGLLDAKYKSFPGSPSVLPSGAQTVINAAGNRMVRAPKFSGSLSVAYTIPSQIGDFKISGTVTNKGKTYDSPDNLLAYPGYTLVNAAIGWTSSDGKLGVDVWAQNLTDKNYYVQKTATAIPFGWLQMAGAPRTYGVRLKAKI